MVLKRLKTPAVYVFSYLICIFENSILINPPGIQGHINYEILSFFINEPIV